jgi:hypothetical protein
MQWTVEEALAFVRTQGIVLEAARGSVPSLAAAIAGKPVGGSWWSHPRAHEIFRITRAVRDSEEVLVCRLVDAKITYVHRELWPALVRAASQLPAEGLAQVKEIHTESGRHAVTTTPFPRWVPDAIRAAAQNWTEDEALRELERRVGSALPRRRQRNAGRRKKG